jgi:hypothetical protein
MRFKARVDSHSIRSVAEEACISCLRTEDFLFPVVVLGALPYTVQTFFAQCLPQVHVVREGFCMLTGSCSCI